MRLRLLLAAAIAATLALLPSSASAGGWWSWIDLKGRYLGVGETVVLRSEVMFRTLEAAEAARTSGDYHAYLLRGWDKRLLERAMLRPDPKRWWRPPAEMTLVGDVKLSQWESNLAMSTAYLTIPELPPGNYDLMLCNTGCTTPLGDLVPLGVQVSADALTASTARRLAKTNSKLDLALARLRNRLQETERSADHAEVAANDAEASGRLLEKKLSDSLAAEPATPWGAYAGWFLAGAVVAAALLMRSRPRAPKGSPPTQRERAPMDVSEESKRGPREELVSR